MVVHGPGLRYGLPGLRSGRAHVQISWGRSVVQQLISHAPVSRCGACGALVGIITAAPLSGSESAHRICALYRGITSIAGGIIPVPAYYR